MYTLSVIIASLCGINGDALSKVESEENKLICVDHFVNCMIELDGVINFNKLPTCTQDYNQKVHTGKK